MRVLGAALAYTAAEICALPARAQTPPTPPAGQAECFDIVRVPPNEQPHAMVLLNRCTGATWILVKTFFNDASGRPTASFSFRWHPIASATDEGLLVEPGSPP